MVEHRRTNVSAKVQGALENLQTELNGINEDEVRQLAVDDLREVEDIECEASSLVTQAKALVDMACNTIGEGLKERDGRPGCLQGELSDYLHSLEQMLDKMHLAFANNKEKL